MSKKISKDKVVLRIPQKIRELAQEFRQQRVTKEEAEKQEKRRIDAEQKRIRASRLKNGLKYATKVFLWAKALQESDIGQELMKKSFSNLFFFDGHIIGVEWVGLGISSDGLFRRYGGKGYSNQQVLSPKDLAKSVETVTLKAASEWIDNGEVWDCIKRRFDYLKK